MRTRAVRRSIITGNSTGDGFMTDLLRTVEKYGGVIYAFDMAIEAGDLEACITLIVHDPQIVHYGDGISLGKAAEHGYLRICKLLLDNGADVHGRHEEALTMASRHNHFKVCKLLLKHGASLSALIKNDRYFYVLPNHYARFATKENNILVEEVHTI